MEALHSYSILDTRDEAIFDELVKLAASLMDTPVALITLIDERRQWFKARVGLDIRETPRDAAICSHAIQSQDVLVIPDAREDARVTANPFVDREPGIRFYAGAPLITRDGYAIGALCVIDYKPREVAREKIEALRTLSRHVMTQIELRRELHWVAADACHREMVLDRVREAFQREQFELSYRPQVDESGQIAGAEAVLRWQHPRDGWVEMDRLIPLLEESGLILPVGEWMLKQVVQQQLQWRAGYARSVPLTVSLSPLQLAEDDFPARIDHITRGADIHFQLSESALLDPSSETKQALSILRNLGHRIVLANFGLGHGSLKHLADFPVDALKIDRFFVVNMLESAAGMTLVSTLISLAKALQLEVIAEGVDTCEQHKLLRLLGCDRYQGWFHGRSVPAERFARRLRESESRTDAAPASC